MTIAKQMCVGAVLAAVAVAAAPAAAQGVGTLQRALDKPINLRIEDATIGEVFEKISAASGAKLVIDPDALDYLPYGDQTRLSVTLANATLRKRLDALLAGVALQWQIDGEEVRILPSEPLYRMGRRATYDELRILAGLNTARVEPSDRAGPVLEQIRKVTGTAGLDIVFHTEIDRDKALARADKALPGSPVAWLDMLCHGADATWHLWGDDILVQSRSTQVKRQLQRTVSLRYQNAALVTVLADLARKGRVQLQMDPGVMEYLPDQTRTNFNLVMADASIAQALEVISGATGLKFDVTAEGVRAGPSDLLKRRMEGATTEPRKRTPYFVKFVLPGPNGTSVEVFMRADELPPELFKAIEAEKDKFVRKLHEELAKPE